MSEPNKVDRDGRATVIRALTAFRDDYKFADDEPFSLWVPASTDDTAVPAIYFGVPAYFRDRYAWGARDFWVEGGPRPRHGCGRFGDAHLVHRCLLFLASDRRYEWPVVEWWKLQPTKRWDWSQLSFKEDWSAFDRQFEMGKDFEFWPFSDLEEYVEARLAAGTH